MTSRTTTFVQLGTAGIALLLAGCGSRLNVKPIHTGAAPAEQVEPKEVLPLEELGPAPRMPAPTTEPVGEPPIAALDLFARGHDALLRGQPIQAVELLNKAVALDPDRFDLRYELGRAYLAAGGADDSAVVAFEQAARLRPDHLRVQCELGRLYLDKADPRRAIEHLRLATATTAYTDNDPDQDDGTPAVADYLLARALKQGGFDRAALDRYLILIKRFGHLSQESRNNPDLMNLLERPSVLYQQVGELLEKHGEFDQALKVLQPAADDEPENLDLQGRVARDLARAGHDDLAVRRALDLIVRDKASPATLLLLDQVCRLSAGHDRRAVDELQKLSTERPDDVSVLLALADTLLENHRTSEAVDMLASAWTRYGADLRLTRRLFAVYKQSQANRSAASLLISAATKNPDTAEALAPLWLELFQTGRELRLTPDDADTLRGRDTANPSASEEAARQFFIAVLADDRARPQLMQQALSRGTLVTPPFAPVFRRAVRMIFRRTDLDEAKKAAACEPLIVAAKGDPSLVLELRGMIAVARHQTADAAATLDRALAESNPSRPSATLRLAAIEAHHAAGLIETDYEQSLWDLTAACPQFDDTYETLIRARSDKTKEASDWTSRVVSTWLANDPQSVPGRLAQARLLADAGQLRQAELILLQLWDQDADAADIYAGLKSFYQQGRINDLIALLETAHQARPTDTTIVAKLAELYAGQKRNTDAVRLLDQTRDSIVSNATVSSATGSNDAELLYSLSSLYNPLDQKQLAEELLEQVLKLNPGHAGASNDLGFDLINENRDVPRAEALVRAAVNAEPDNQWFLDSLGWVLYKRGRLDDARKTLEQATGPVGVPDAVVLDHLGDTLYRLNKTDEAKQVWQRSLAALANQKADREDLKQLRLKLLEKTRQLEAGKPVDVAPVITAVPTTPTLTGKLK